MSWHIGSELARRYAAAPQDLDAPDAASVEAHLLTCSVCRHAVAHAADRTMVAQSWQAVVDVIDRPRANLLGRVLGRLGVPTGMVRLVSATPSMAAAWFGAVLATVLVVVALARAEGSPGPFLAVAPLVPVAVVWLAFAPLADPGGEAAVATPVQGLDMVVRRLVTVATPAAVALSVGALAVPGATTAALAWLVPGVALAVGCVALGTVIRLRTAARFVVVTWVSVLALSVADGPRALGDSVVFAAQGQLVWALGTVVGAVVCWRRRERFSTWEVAW